MTITAFTRELFETGTVIAEPWNSQAEFSSELVEVIERAHARAQAEAAFQSPELDLNAAAWSLNVLAWGSALFINRTEVNTELPAVLANAEPRGETASEHWSVDLGFRFFHSLIVRCRRAGPYDSLVQQLIAVGSRWPLATVGVHTEVDLHKLEVLLLDRCLRSLLIDRVVERNDDPLSKHPLLESHVAQAVGSQPNFKSWSVNSMRF